MAAPVPRPRRAPEPVSPEPPVSGAPPLLTQSWLDLAFVHWAADPADVAPLLPPGTAPDVLHGTTYVGLVAFRMHRTGWFGLPGLPYLGSFPETNVRLYSVDARGRRGVVFRSLDAARLIPATVGLVGFGMPYRWSRMSVRRDGVDGARLTYTSTRRWPGPRGARCLLTVRTGEPVAEPDELEHFLTARWGLHTSLLGRTALLPNEHPRWPLHRAELLACDEDLVRAAGLPAPSGRPVSVLYSPGVRVRFPLPVRVPGRRRRRAREAGRRPGPYGRGMRPGAFQYDIQLRPQTADSEGHPDHGPVLRTFTVHATGAQGESGYPRYAGEGVEADVDPRTRTVEAITVDGEELPYGWVALVAPEDPAEGPADGTARGSADDSTGGSADDSADDSAGGGDENQAAAG